MTKTQAKRPPVARRGKPAADGAARERILEAAIDLFNRKGYAAAAVSEIVDAAGITKPVLYYYFDSKEGLFLEMMNEGTRRFREIVERDRSADGADAAEAVRRFCHELLDLIYTNLHVIRVMHAIYYGPPQGAPHVDFERFHRGVLEALRRLMRRGIDEGIFRDTDPGFLTWAVAGALSVATETKLCHPEVALGHKDFDRVLDAIYRGLLVGPRRARKEV